MPLANLIQRGDLNQRLTKALEIKGQKSPVLTLDNNVVAVVIAEDLTKQSAWLSPTEKKICATFTIAAVAAQFGILAVTNPVGSGVIAIVERVVSVSGVISQFKFGLVDPLAVPAGLANMFFRDRRNSGAATCRAFQGTDAVLRVVNEYLNFQVSTSVPCPWFETEGIVIQPGETFGIQSTVASNQITPTIWLEEIPIA